MVRAGYDAVAEDYASAFGDELAGLPLDRALLEQGVELGGARRWVVEVGCGPAPAAALLADVAPRWLAVDLSARMVQVARTRRPALAAIQADARRLPVADGACSMVVAYYVVQHLPPAEVPVALGEFRRVLGSGLLVLATHLGQGHVLLEDFLGHRITPMGGALHDRAELVGQLERAGFEILRAETRRPVPGEFETERLYVLARARSRR